MPRAVLVYSSIIGPHWITVEQILDEMGWSYYPLYQGTRAQVLSALADPEVVAYFAEGHGDWNSFTTGADSITADSLKPVLDSRDKLKFCYFQHCDALNTVSGDCWAQVFGKGDPDSGIALTGQRFYNEFNAGLGNIGKGYILLKRMLEYIQEGYAVHAAWQQAALETRLGYDPDTNRGIAFYGDHSITLAPYNPKPRALVIGVRSGVTESQSPWYLGLKAIGYHPVWYDQLSFFVNDQDMYRPSIEAIFKQPETVAYTLTVEDGSFTGSSSYMVNAVAGYPEYDFPAQQVAAWMSEKPNKMQLVVLEHRDSLGEIGPGTWISAFSQGNLTDIAILGWVQRPNYSTNQATYTAWRSAFLQHLIGGMAPAAAFAAANRDVPAIGELSYNSQVVMLGEEHYDYTFFPGEDKTARARFTATPAGVPLLVEVWLTRDGVIQDASTGLVPVVSTGIQQVLDMPLVMPPDESIYRVYLRFLADGGEVAVFDSGKLIRIIG